jgi:cation diffusion facilitator family transporter
MTDTYQAHDHIFLGAGHEKSERRTWMVIWLCDVMMVAEIIGGMLFGSIALVADGLHMSTHASVPLLAALAYSYARRHASDGRFTFGTGKLGDLAGFASAIVLAMIALLIGYEAVTRFISPVPINIDEAIPIAVLGLIVNVASVLLLSGGEHHHGHGRDHTSHARHHEDARRIEASGSVLLLEIVEEGVRPRFRLSWESGREPLADHVTIDTVRPWEGVPFT